MRLHLRAGVSVSSSLEAVIVDWLPLRNAHIFTPATDAPTHMYLGKCTYINTRNLHVINARRSAACRSLRRAVNLFVRCHVILFQLRFFVYLLARIPLYFSAISCNNNLHVVVIHTRTYTHTHTCTHTRAYRFVHTHVHDLSAAFYYSACFYCYCMHCCHFCTEYA